MKKYCRNASGVAELFVVDLIPIAGTEMLRLQLTTCLVKAPARAI
eukprot:CAMPEP_0172945712 /NCGR_PEP_ID=MMETSP1075-20121228/226691_1 /TAXON_ID=2916 /ORGANISM="Ceratium fusus, Strain PA161109" /LENGTH=44 /DNA_ID= /DNA_START= /DNA_END= /DNA_ORIENTATION=